MVQVLRQGYQIPFLNHPPLSPVPICLPSYSPSSIKGKALASEVEALILKGAVELAPSDPGYYSRVFVTLKASGAWRPIIDLSILNKMVRFTKFHLETPQSVLRSVRPGDWMISLDLKDAYLQIPIHQGSRKYLRFVTSEGTFQFKVLPFGLTTSPQVFTRVMAPVSAMMHRSGYRMLRYLDDWLVLGSSLAEVTKARDFLLSLCTDLGIRINFDKSHLTPSQTLTYLGMEIHSSLSKASPTPERILKFSTQLEEFRSSREQPASLWRSLLGRMSSLSLLVPGSRLRMRSLQLVLKRDWDFQNDSLLVRWDSSCLEDLQWWSEESNLTPGVPLEIPRPDVHLYTDASDQGWGATLEEAHASGLWSLAEAAESINFRELLAVHRALVFFKDHLRSLQVALFCDNSTAISYLKKAGGTRSSSLNQIAQEILRLCEELSIHLMPQFVAGSLNVLADALSRKDQVLGAEWTLCPQVFKEVQRRWPVLIDLFATSLNHRLPLYFSPVQDPQALATDAMLQDWEGLEAYAFPPFALIHQVLSKLRQTKNCYLTLIAPFWPHRPWFADLLELLVDVPVSLPLRIDLLRQPHFNRLHHNLLVLKLTAWRVSSCPPGMSASLRQWLANLPSVGGSPLA